MLCLAAGLFVHHVSNFKVMRLLVIQGAFVDLANAAGLTPIAVANMYNMSVPVELLAGCNFVSSSTAQAT